MSKRKICIVITTRGNYAKMKSVIVEINKHPNLECQVILGGSIILDKYGRILDKSDIFDSLPPVREIHFLLEGETPITMAKSAGIALSEFSTAFDELKPDIVIVIADRFECLPIAMAASYMNIPVAHVEGGEVSGSIDESIRHAITKLSHVHFPATLEAAERIGKMGEIKELIFPVGATSFDVIRQLKLDDISPIMEAQKTGGVGPVLDLVKGEYLIVIQHPVTTEYESNYENVYQTIKAIDELGMPAIWIWPNMDAGSDGISKALRVYREGNPPRHVHFFKSLAIELFAPLLSNAACIVGNSSSGIREASFFGTPTVNIGSRQNGRDKGENVVDVESKCEIIKEAIIRQLENGKYDESELYGDGYAAEKIVEVLATQKIDVQKQITY